MQTFHWLSLDFASAKFYEYSKDPREGFEAHTNTKGKVSYRFYYRDGVIGNFKGVAIRENRALKKQELLVQLVTETDVFNIQLPLLGANGTSYSSYTEDVIRKIANLKVGETHKLFCYLLSAEDRAKSAKESGITVKGTFKDKKGIAIGTCTESGENYKRVESVTLPKIEFKTKGDLRKPTAVSIEARQEAAEEILLAAMPTFDILKNSSASLGGPTSVPPAYSSTVSATPNGQIANAAATVPAGEVDDDPLF